MAARTPSLPALPLTQEQDVILCDYGKHIIVVPKYYTALAKELQDIQKKAVDLGAVSECNVACVERDHILGWAYNPLSSCVHLNIPPTGRYTLHQKYPQYVPISLLEEKGENNRPLVVAGIFSVSIRESMRLPETLRNNKLSLLEEKCHACFKKLVFNSPVHPPLRSAQGDPIPSAVQTTTSTVTKRYDRGLNTASSKPLVDSLHRRLVDDENEPNLKRRRRDIHPPTSESFAQPDKGKVTSSISTLRKGFEQKINKSETKVLIPIISAWVETLKSRTSLANILVDGSAPPWWPQRRIRYDRFSNLAKHELVYLGSDILLQSRDTDEIKRQSPLVVELREIVKQFSASGFDLSIFQDAQRHEDTTKGMRQANAVGYPIVDGIPHNVLKAPLVTAALPGSPVESQEGHSFDEPLWTYSAQLEPLYTPSTGNVPYTSNQLLFRNTPVPEDLHHINTPAHAQPFASLDAVPMIYSTYPDPSIPHQYKVKEEEEEGASTMLEPQLQRQCAEQSHDVATSAYHSEHHFDLPSFQPYVSSDTRATAKSSETRLTGFPYKQVTSLGADGPLSPFTAQPAPNHTSWTEHMKYKLEPLSDAQLLNNEYFCQSNTDRSFLLNTQNIEENLSTAAHNQAIGDATAMTADAHIPVFNATFVPHAPAAYPAFDSLQQPLLIKQERNASTPLGSQKGYSLTLEHDSTDTACISHSVTTLTDGHMPRDLTFSSSTTIAFLPRSASKRELFDFLGLSTPLHEMLVEDAIKIRDCLSMSQVNLLDKCKAGQNVQMPYKWVEISETAKQWGIRMMVDANCPVKRVVYAKGQYANTRGKGNWVANWYLYNSFRSRDKPRYPN